MVVPFGAGGPTDALARILTQRMSVTLGQQVVIENVTGGAGTIGIGRVARAAPDGYTLVIGNWASHVVNSAIYKTPVRLCERFRAGRAALRQPVHHRRQERAAEDAARADRLAEGQSRQGDRRHRRRRLRPACRRGLFPEGHRHALPVRALSGRLLRRDARRRRRTHRLHHRSGDLVAALHPPGPGARLRGRGQQAARLGAGYPDRRRGRRARRPCDRLVRHVDAERHAEGRDREVQRGRASRRWPIRRCASSSPASARIFPRPRRRPSEALGKFYKAEIDKWWPIIREAGIKVE